MQAEVWREVFRMQHAVCFPAQQSVLLDFNLADRCSDRHKYQRVCLEFFDSETIDNSSAAQARPLQYPYAKWHIWMLCICPRERHDTNTATLNDSKTAAQPCARHAVKLN